MYLQRYILILNVLSLVPQLNRLAEICDFASKRGMSLLVFIWNTHVNCSGIKSCTNCKNTVTIVTYGQSPVEVRVIRTQRRAVVASRVSSN